MREGGREGGIVEVREGWRNRWREREREKEREREREREREQGPLSVSLEERRDFDVALAFQPQPPDDAYSSASASEHICSLVQAC